MTPSTLLRVSVQLDGKDMRAWQGVEVSYHAYQRLLEDLDPLTVDHLMGTEHQLSINLHSQRALNQAVGIIDHLVNKVLSQEPDPDQLRVPNMSRQLPLVAA